MDTGDRAERTVLVDGERWLACPAGGLACCRVSATVLGDQWAADAMARHVELHHQRWR